MVDNFRVTAQYWEKCTEWPQTDLDIFKVRKHISPPPVSISHMAKILSISLYAEPFWVADQFCKKCTEWLQNVTEWPNEEQKWPFCHGRGQNGTFAYLIYLWGPNFIGCVLWCAVFVFWPNFEKSARNGDKRTMIRWRLNVLVCLPRAPRGPTFRLFRSIRSTVGCFRAMTIFWEKCTEWPQNGPDLFSVSSTHSTYMLGA